MNIHRVLEPLMRPFRLRRMRHFMALMQPAAGTRVLDVGGTPFNWRLIGYPHEVVLLNLEPGGLGALPPNFSSVVGDGTALAYGDATFEICFSNSVIEHVGSWEQQRRFADELRRVGRRLWVQTPARSFFFEPHLLTPFVHWLPVAWRKRLLRNFSIWGWIARPSQAVVDRFVDQTRLLGYRELQDLFPDCRILRERFCGMTKAYLVVRGAHG